MSCAAMKTFLGKKHICVPNEWINACLNFVKLENENNNKINDNSFLMEKIFEQWLHADLTELATSCLPFGLPKQKVTKINGYFALQVNRIKDVGTPAYNQLQKIRKYDAANTEVSADKPMQATWEPKASRMLMMQLTDGTSVVEGIEYQPIPSLSISLTPGCKILITGAVEVRRGILLLKAENVSVLGGEVDSILVPNAPENILCRSLGLEEKERPNKINESLMMNELVQPSQTSQYYPSQLTQTNIRQQPAGPAIRTTINPSLSSRVAPNFSAPSKKTNFIAPQCNKRRPTISINRMDLSDDDDFLDSATENALLEAEELATRSYNKQFKVPKTTQSIAIAGQSSLTIKVEEKCDIGVPTSMKMDISPGRDAGYRMTAKPKSNTRNNNPLHDTVNMDVFDSDDELFLEADLDLIESVNRGVFNPTRTFSSGIASATSTAGQSSSKQVEPNERLLGNLKDLPPFQYLCFLPKIYKQKTTFIVKAFVMTLLSKLSHEKGSYQLTANINDGTAAAEVAFDDKVVERLMGLSAEELTQQKTRAIKEQSLRAIVMQRVKNCQKELITLSCLFHLEVKPGMAKPLVTGLTTLNRTHLTQLNLRKI